ncbi:MAG TPA: DNA polymerase III subunit delta [Blastocatellia bacterium]|nr:DNA polymerase III subunit delta [Blastocatellia bacterium]
MSRRPKKKLDGLTFDEFRRQVKQGHVEPLYLFVGEERYFQERALALLYKEVDEAGRMFNISLFSIGESRPNAPPVRAASAIDAANQWPMMAARRVVVIRDFEKIREDENDLVLEYLKRPSQQSTVVFQAASLDQRRKVTTALLKACTVVTFDRLSESQAARWAEEYLRRRDCRIEHGALNYLIALVGTKMARLVSELDKLSTYSGGGSITNDIVEKLVPRAREHSNFELWDAILERDRRRAIRLTQRVLDDGAEPVMLVGALAGLYRRMLAAKDLMARKAPSEEIMKATGQYGQRAAAFNARVLRTPREEIVHGLRRIAQVDNAIKGSEATPRLQLEYLIAELTLPESARYGIFH